jgi:ubiquinone/menaquinone biosynthesis C-methylase UbiE
MTGRITDSLNFLFSGMFLAAVSLMALPLVVKEKVPKHSSRRELHAFLMNKKRAVVYYNVLSPVYDMMNPHLYTSLMRDEVMKLVDSKKLRRVLDVGCGTGYTTEGVLRLESVGEVVGIDQNHKQLQRAKQNLNKEKRRFSLSRGEVENLPFMDESFDAVVSVGAIEYFPDPEKALKEMARVVKQGGIVIVGGPEFKWFRKVLLNKFFYTPARGNFGDLFYKAGLKKVNIVMTGVATFFGTDKYVLIAAGTKERFLQTER